MFVVFFPAHNISSFKNGGLALSIALMVILASICTVAFQLLVIVQRNVGGSYGDVAKNLYGPWLRYLVLFFLCISQMGFVASYLIFISDNIYLVSEALSQCNPPFESKYWIWIAICIVIPITWVRKIARLGWAAIVADVFILFGLICVLYYTSNQIHQHGVGPNIITVNQNSFGLMIGTAVFSFEGIGMGNYHASWTPEAYTHNIFLQLCQLLKAWKNHANSLWFSPSVWSLSLSFLFSLELLVISPMVKTSKLASSPICQLNRFQSLLSFCTPLLWSLHLLSCYGLLWPSLNAEFSALSAVARSHSNGNGSRTWFALWFLSFVLPSPLVSAVTIWISSSPSSALLVTYQRF